MQKVLGVMVLFLTSAAVAEENVTSHDTFMEKRIREGDWNIGLGADFVYDSANGARVNAAVDAQYFWWDLFSVGIVGKYQHLRNLDYYGLGIKGTYHFYETARSTFYIAQDFTYNLADVTGEPGNRTAVLSTTGIGWNYFFNPNVAFGPKLEWAKVLGEGSSSGDSQTSVKLNFSIFF